MRSDPGRALPRRRQRRQGGHHPGPGAPRGRLRPQVPVENAYVRLLDRTGEFTAEVPTNENGHFRFFAGDGEWTLRTLAPRAEAVDKKVTAQVGSVAEVAIAV